MAPESEELFGVEVEVDDEPDPDMLGVRVDCETPIVDVGKVETVPVTSGVSGRVGRMNSVCVYAAERSRTSYGLCRRDVPVVTDL